MEKKIISILDVVTNLIVLVLGAVVIDFVMNFAGGLVEHGAYYREMRWYAIAAFEVLMMARFVADKMRDPMQILKKCRKAFSGKSVLFFVVFLFFLLASLVCYVICITIVVEPGDYSMFLSSLISLVVLSCVTTHFFNRFLGERLKVQEERERKAKVVITEEMLKDKSIHINFKTPKEETNDTNSTLH